MLKKTLSTAESKITIDLSRKYAEHYEGPATLNILPDFGESVNNDTECLKIYVSQATNSDAKELVERFKNEAADIMALTYSELWNKFNGIKYIKAEDLTPALVEQRIKQAREYRRQYPAKEHFVNTDDTNGVAHSWIFGYIDKQPTTVLVANDIKDEYHTMLIDMIDNDGYHISAMRDDMCAKIQSDSEGYFLAWEIKQLGDYGPFTSVSEFKNFVDCATE